MTEVIPWLDEVMTDSPIIMVDAQKALEVQLQSEVLITREYRYESSIFPAYSIELPKPWEVAYVNNNNLVITQTVEGEQILVFINVNHFPYLVPEETIEYILKKKEKNQYDYKNYQREKLSFEGVSGYQIQYDDGSHRNINFFGAKENTVFSIQTYIPLSYKEEAQAKVDELLSSFAFVNNPNNTSLYLQEYDQSFPAVSMRIGGEYFFSPEYDSQNEDVVVEIENQNELDLIFYVYQHELNEDYWELSIEEIFEQDLQYRSNIVNQYPDVVIDGIPGYAYTYEYQGDDFNQTRRRTVVEVFLGKKYFQVSYDNLAENHQKDVDQLVALLRSFTYEGPENIETKGQYNVPDFTSGYQDISEHLYERQIKALSSKGILSIPGENFYPDELISREDALKAIIQSKIFVEDGRNLQETSEAVESTSTSTPLTDIQNEELQKVALFAMNKGLIKKQASFNPEGPVHVVDALQMLCKLYELQIWQPSYSEQVPWYIPYIYKGMTLDVIPERMVYYDQMTRGQFASMLYTFVRTVGERNDL